MKKILSVLIVLCLLGAAFWYFRVVLGPELTWADIYQMNRDWLLSREVPH